MADLRQFKLPDVGEGLTEAEIVTWKVKAGDVLTVNDVIVEIETAKSLVELPSPYAGTVTELLCAEGDTVEVGRPIITVDVGGEDPGEQRTPPAEAVAAGTTDAPPADTSEADGQRAQVQREHSLAEDLVPSPKEDEAVEPGLIGGPAPGGRTSVLVGYGPRTTEAKRRPRKPSAAQAATQAAAQAGVQQSFATHGAPAPTVDVDQVSPVVPAEPDAGRKPLLVADPLPPQTAVLAKPPVRKLAKDLGVDLRTVTPTGPEGTISRDDVNAAHDAHDDRARQALSEPPISSADWVMGTHETRVPVKGVRKMTAQAMVASAFTAPHVTEWITVDVTRAMELVAKLKGNRDLREVKVSPLLVIARAVCLALRRTPELNASWDEPAQEIVLKTHVNLGIAAATPRGLMVPNIKNANAMRLVQLAEALGQLVDTARAGRTQPGDMAGGTFTITNVGVFGIDAGTPILNPGESGILAVGAINKRPWVVGEDIVARDVTTLAVSFDHRIVDGEQGSRFLADVAGILEDPATALLF